jgi:hypothetical protein
METDPNVTERERLAVRDGLNRDVAAESTTEQWLAARCAEVGRASGTCVIAVRMGDNRTFYRLPGIDMKVAGGAPQA